ncbi:hypothetical protein V6N12_039490 [Hibiscus sabdariffa]|uniref:DNA polymerase epsilon catalytic subunit n=1 Tax=Hibiscus sabdariffa TaxID=183260 RepID=A0ABR2E0W6_9ROSI
MGESWRDLMKIQKWILFQTGILLSIYLKRFSNFIQTSVAFCTSHDYPVGFWQDHFVLIVSEFLHTYWKYAQEQAANRTSSLDGSLCTPSITITAAKNFEAHTVKYLKDQVSSYFTEKLLGIVRDFVLHMKGLSGSGKVDQQRAHKAPHKGDAALEFIKHVCAVLARLQCSA